MPIDRKIKDRKVICVDCGKTRLVTYSQEWNIKKEKCNNFCLSCAAKNGETVNNIGLKRASSETLSNAFKKSYKEGRKKVVMIGKDNPSWKEKGYSYTALHQWVYRKKGKASKCISCGFEGKCSWANIEHTYKREVDDFISLCYSCHKLLDNKKI